MELARFVIAGLDGLILRFISGGRDTIQAQRDLDHLIHAVIALAEGQRTYELFANKQE